MLNSFKIPLNVNYTKILHYYHEQDFVTVLNLLYSNKEEVQLLNSQITNLFFECLEAICLFRLDYKDSFANCIDIILGYDDSYFSNLEDKKADLIASVLLLAVFNLIYNVDLNDVNQFSEITNNKLNLIQTKYNLITNKSELITLIETALYNAMTLNNKNEMQKLYFVIINMFDKYFNRLSIIFYDYRFITDEQNI